MKIDLTQAIKDLDGNDLLISKEKEKKINGQKQFVIVNEPMNIRSVIMTALADYADPNATNEEKMSMWCVAKDIRDAKDSITLRDTDLSLIKKAVGKRYVPLIVGQVFDLLNSEVREKK